MTKLKFRQEQEEQFRVYGLEKGLGKSAAARDRMSLSGRERAERRGETEGLQNRTTIRVKYHKCTRLVHLVCRLVCARLGLRL